eukprot:c16382_g2_i1 orf=1-1659(-)
MLRPHGFVKRIQAVYHRAVGNLSSLAMCNCRKAIEEIHGGDVWDDLRTLCKHRHWQMVLRLLDVQKQQYAHFNFIEAYCFLLQECVEVKALAEAKQIHAHIKNNELDHVMKLNDILLYLYVKCCDFEAAREVFDMMRQKDINSWTLLIGGYITYGHPEEAFKLFWRMEFEGVKPNGITFVGILKACTMITRLMMVHAYVISLGLHLNFYIRNTLLNMYFKCGSVEDAIYIFAQLPIISEISWNTLIAGHTQHGFLDKAFELFQDMKLKGAKPDEVTFLSIIKAGMCNLESLKQLHVEICYNGLQSNSFVASALIDMYAAFRKMKYARKVFDAVLLRDAPLWNSMLFCYAEYGDAMEALSLYAEMEEDGIVPDKVTFLSLLKACVSLRYLAMGKSIYSRITQAGFDKGAFVSSALVDMYVKCGNFEDARHIFNSMPKRDLVSWNAIIAGYATHEHATEAFNLFRKMKSEGVKPDNVTFLTILKACASSGAFEQGKYIHTCVFDNGFHSDVFVGSTLVDMYGKCGSVHHAREVFNSMPQRDEVSWSAMIAGYAQH